MSKEINPARLKTEEVAQLLGFADHDIPVLVSKKLLKPLGKPAQSAVKYFATCEVAELANEAPWLNKATQAIYDYWIEKNARKSAHSPRMTVPAVPSISLAE